MVNDLNEIYCALYESEELATIQDNWSMSFPFRMNYNGNQCVAFAFYTTDFDKNMFCGMKAIILVNSELKLVKLEQDSLDSLGYSVDPFSYTPISLSRKQMFEKNEAIKNAFTKYTNESLDCNDPTTNVESYLSEIAKYCPQEFVDNLYRVLVGSLVVVC